MKPDTSARRIPGMLLIGSTSRNSGKTEFACSVLRRFAARVPLIGLKVTVIREDESGCPRGGKGCGVCGSLQGPFALTEEHNRDGRKDTSRLLVAGATKVYWLRVRASCIEEGMSALLERLEPNAIMVCESNSLRRAVRPDLFLMVRDSRTDACKNTARAVLPQADRIVRSDGERFDMDLADLDIRAGAWTLREQATALVMAGGGSTRMGQDKTLLPVGGVPLIQHVCAQLKDVFDEVLVSANDPERFAFLGLPVVPDRTPGCGPLMGLASGLAAARHALVLAVACDIPDIDMHLAHRLLTLAENADAVAPRVTGPLPPSRRTPVEPLFAVYRRDLAPALFTMLDRGERRLRAIFEQCRACYADITPSEAPLNLNTMADYQAYVSEA